MKQSYDSDQEKSTLNMQGGREHICSWAKQRLEVQQEQHLLESVSRVWRPQGCGKGHRTGAHTAAAPPGCTGAHLSTSRVLLGPREGTRGQKHPRQRGHCTGSPHVGDTRKRPRGMEPLTPNHDLPAKRAGTSWGPQPPKAADLRTTWFSVFLGGSDGKESACNARDTSSILGSGRSPGEGNGNPLQYSCQENSMDRGAWQAPYCSWGCKELHVTAWLTLS